MDMELSALLTRAREAGLDERAIDLAEQGLAAAQNDLGWSYRNGEGVEKDLVEAVAWYRKAAEQGHAGAQNNLGGSYYKGEGVDKDLVEAVAWYRKAAEQGDAWAQTNLGVCYYNGEGVDKDLVEAAAWYRKAAEQGHADAQNNLGSNYYNGEGVDKDLMEAVAWYRKAALQGDAEALYMMGDCCRHGDGIPQNYEDSYRWFLKASELFTRPIWKNKCAKAQSDLLRNHLGQSFVLSLHRGAAEQGDADAQYNMGLEYARRQGAEQNAAEAVAWYRKAAEQEHASAQFQLGLCCRDGFGILQNYEDAYRWFLKASVGLTGEVRTQCDNAKSDLQSKHLPQSLVLSLQRELSGSSKQTSKPVRTGISKDAQSFVWNRDGGRCVECGSNENLEFDHIIPVSKGGSNTARNLQLLCEPCNRRKGPSI